MINQLDKELFNAALVGDLLAVKDYITKGANVNATHVSNATALYAASERGFTKIVKYLLKHGANSDIALSYGATALNIAAQNGFTEIVKLLLEAGADTEISCFGNTPLLSAIMKEHFNVVALLLNTGSIIQSEHQTALSMAARKPNNNIYPLVFSYYREYLKSYKPAPSNGKTFRVVVVRFEEDLSWIIDEFGNDIDVIVYNKGSDNLEYLPSNCKIVKIPNTGWLGGTYFRHFVDYYDQLADRTLFLQGGPYESPLFLPLIKYRDRSNSTCPNIVAKCQKTSFIAESNYLTQLDWKNTKFKDFIFGNLSMIEFTNEYIGSYSPKETLFVTPGAEFAVDKEIILRRKIEDYQKIADILNRDIRPGEDHYAERLYVPLFDIQKQDSMTYVINLDHATERWEKVHKQLNAVGESHQRFSATYGPNIIIQNLQTKDVFSGESLKNKSAIMIHQMSHQITCNPGDINLTKFNYAGNSLTAGELGIYCSLFRVLEDAMKNNYEYITIYEDDIKIKVDDYNQKKEDFRMHLPASFDLAYIDLVQYAAGEQIPLANNQYVNSFDSDFISVGMHAIILSKKGIEKLLAYNSYTGPTDIFFWAASVNKNAHNLNNPAIAPLLLEVYGSSQDLLDAEDGYSFINAMR